MKNKFILNNTKPQASPEFEFTPFPQEAHVGHYSQTLSYTAHRFFIDKGIESPEQYRDLIQTLLTAQEGEIVELVISSYGGVIESAMNIISSINESSAVVRAIIMGSCHSSASIIALSCDEVMVFDYANMLCHSATFGSSGRTTEIVSHVKFLEKYLEKLAYDMYKDFLTNEEIKDMLQGKDFWFDADEIRNRLQKRSDAQDKEQARIMKEIKRKQKEETPVKSQKVKKQLDKDPELGI